MLKKFKKRGFVAVLIYFAVVLGFYLFNISLAQAAPVQFVSDVKLDLTGLTSDVYINGDPTGSQCDSLTVSGANLTVSGIPSGNPFTLENASDAILLRLTPSGGTADFSLSSTNVSGGYIIQWNTTSAVLVNYLVGVPLANTDYAVKINGSSIPDSPLKSSPSAQLSFGYTGAGTFTIESPSLPPPPPGEYYNIYGWAWVGVPQAVEPEKLGLGWISFNSENCISNPGNITDMGQCSGGGGNYRVDIDSSTGEFSGYAYFDINDPNTGVNEIGWIDFAPAGPYPTCPGTTCPAGSPNYSVKTDLSCPGNKCWVTGWARVCNVFQTGCSGVLKSDSERGGWDGWILLGPIVKGGTDYGVYIDTTLSPAQIKNWAWGSDVVGWISFKKVMTDLVISAPPSANTLNAETIYGCEISPIVRFSWIYSGSNPQSAYEIQIDDDSDLDESPLVTISGGADNSREYAGPGVSPSWWSYDAQYWWRLKVWDSTNQESARIYPSPLSFDTGSRWPAPDFTWDPEAPSVGQDVTFANQTQYCGAGGCSYSWDFDDGGSSTDFEPIHAFLTERSYNVILTATSAGHSCSCPHNVNVGAVLPTPIWKEIPPTF